MKKVVFSLLMIFCLPLVVKADVVDVPSANMSLDLPNSWYVFTRDNIENNSELEELGLTYDFMNDLFSENDMYIDAFDEEVEFIVSIVDIEDVGSLNDYFDSDLNDLGETLQEVAGADSYEIYKNDYKFIYLEYMDAGYYIINYYTVIDNQAYTITIQKETDFTNDEKTTFKSIVDSINFSNYKVTDNNKEKIIVVAGIALVVILGIVAVIIAKVKSKENV